MKYSVIIRLLSLFLGLSFYGCRIGQNADLKAQKPQNWFGIGESNSWRYLENSTFRIGIDISRGGAIGYLALRSNNENVLNSYDEGRFIQQSYYGDHLGGVWTGKAWPWNPVQGGSSKGDPASILAYKNDGDTLLSQANPLDWASGLPVDVEMEQTIQLYDDYIKVHMKFKNNDRDNTRDAHQELPAVFLDAAFLDFVVYKDANPWQKELVTKFVSPGAGNRYEKITENWAAYVNDDNFGVGVYVPGVTDVTYYRFTPVERNGSSSPDCSYFAPIKKMKITKGMIYEYDAYITIGKLDTIRETFYKIRNENLQQVVSGAKSARQ